MHLKIAKRVTSVHSHQTLEQIPGSETVSYTTISAMPSSAHSEMSQQISLELSYSLPSSQDVERSDLILPCIEKLRWFDTIVLRAPLIYF